MFRFENQQLLYLLLIIVAFIAGYIFFQIRDKRKLEKYCDKELLEKLTPQRSQGMKHFKFSLLMLALAFFIIAAANPQTAGKVEKVKRQGVDIMICLDVSNSMKATDIQPNRLSACKTAINRFIDKLQGDRIGLVVFAGKAFVQLPITSDYAAAKMFVNQIDTRLMPVQGTDISAALETAAAALTPSEETLKIEPQENKKTSKVILLASDGEDHFPESIEVAEELHKDGFIIHTIGIGSTKGTPIPAKPNGTQFMKDKSGNTVITRLNEQILKTIANNGHGVYVHATNANMGFESILNEINAMDKSEIDEMDYTHYQSLYIYPVLIGFILLLIDSLLFTSKPKIKDWISTARRKFKVSSLLILCLIALSFASCKDKTRPSLIKEANEKFANGDSLRAKSCFEPDSLQPFDTTGNSLYMQALALYDSTANTEIINYNEAKFNQITAHYRLNNFDTIRALSDTLTQTSLDKKFIAQVYYNKGNAFMQQQQYGAAIDAYKESLRNDPTDMDAKYNLVYAKKMAETHGDGGGGGGQGQQQQKQDQQQNGQGNDQKDGQDKQQQNGQNGQQQNQQQQQQGQGSEGQKGEQGQESAASREQRAAMMRQLDALQQNERQTQQKIMIDRSRGDKDQNRNKQEKDW